MIGVSLSLALLPLGIGGEVRGESYMCYYQYTINDETGYQGPDYAPSFSRRLIEDAVRWRLAWPFTLHGHIYSERFCVVAESETGDYVGIVGNKIDRAAFVEAINDPNQEQLQSRHN